MYCATTMENGDAVLLDTKKTIILFASTAMKLKTHKKNKKKKTRYLIELFLCTICFLLLALF